MVQWKGVPSEDATWEGEGILKPYGLMMLEEKHSSVGEGYHVPLLAEYGYTPLTHYIPMVSSGN